MVSKYVHFSGKSGPQDAQSSGSQGNASLEERVIDALHTIYDPEIPVNIYDLGLIYDLKISDDGKVFVKMTLTTPGCPVAGSMPAAVESTLQAVAGVEEVVVELVWDPPWTPDRLSDEAKLQLGMFE